MARFNQFSGNSTSKTSHRFQTRPCGSITRSTREAVIEEAKLHAIHEPHHRFTVPAELPASGGKWQSLVWHEIANQGVTASEL